MKAPVAVLLVLAALGTSVLGAQSVEQGGVLSPGDSLRIVVWRKPELSGSFMVGADGAVMHPLYRAVKVAGVPFATAESRLQTFLRDYEANPQLVIEPLFRVTVTGEVRQPNVYTVRPETSVSQAVALAGGPTERGQRDRVHLVRQGRDIVVDLTHPEAGPASEAVHSGDQIVVERERAVFREVVAPALGVLGAIAAIVNVAVNSRGNR